MRRSDHSMLPPTPAATIAFGSPNACNLCHKDKTPEWADNLVRTWRKRDYQEPVLHRAGLIDAARKRDWTRLQDILAYLESERTDTVFTTSLIRLLGGCDDERKWPVLLKLVKDPSPLVRSAAAESLATNGTNQAAKELVQSTRDEYRLVRIRGAASLAGFPASLVQDGDRSSLTNATNEYVQSLATRPDHWSSHYNLGNYFLSRGMLKDALTAFQTAAKLDVHGIQPLVNMSIAQARTGNLQSAEDSLVRALALDPRSAAANFNMGLLKAEQGDLPEAERCLRKALAEDPVLAEAAYNLSIILAEDRLEEAVLWAEKAANLRKRDPKYAYTYGFFLNTKGDLSKASEILNKVVEAHPKYPDSYILLGAIYEKQGKTDEALGLYRRGLSQEDLPEQARRFINMKLQKISPK
jgi:tetratricopeptide (TPR) repeat protein